MDALTKLVKEKEQDMAFLMEANDILRDVWNRGLLDEIPVLKRRLAKLLQVKEGELA